MAISNSPSTLPVRTLQAFLAIVFSSILIACGSGGGGNKGGGILPPTTTMTLTGFITETTGAGGSLAVESVSVKAVRADTGAVLQTATTNSAGIYRLTLPQNTGVLLLVTPPALVENPWGGYRHGYFPTTRQLHTSSQNARLDISLGAASVNTFDPAVDTTLGVTGSTSTVEGGQVDVKADSLVRADGQPMAVGDVNILLQPIDVSAEAGSGSLAGISAFPGDMQAVRANGSSTSIASYGAMTVKFFDAEGNRLQLKNGETATIRIPVPASLQASAPTTIEMWWFNEETGLWVEEGTMALSTDGTYYEANVSHFTTWNADIPVEVADVTATLQYVDGTPVRGAMVQLNGIDYAYQRVGVSDATGRFTLKARRGYDARIKVLVGSESQTFSPIVVLDAASYDAGILTVTLNKPETSNGVVEKTFRLVKEVVDNPGYPSYTYYHSQALYLAHGLVTDDSSLFEGADLAFHVDTENNIPTMGFTFSHAAMSPGYTPTRGMQLLNQSFDSLTTAPATGYQDCATHYPPDPECSQPYGISTATPTNKVYAFRTGSGYYGKLVIKESVEDDTNGDWLITVRYKLNMDGGSSL